MRTLKVISLLALILAIIVASFFYLIPFARSFSRNEYALVESSMNAECGYYKIPLDKISILKIDDTKICFSAENYLFNRGKSELTRSIPVTYINNKRVDVNWTVELADHEFMKTPVACVLRNLVTRDSVKILMDNFEAIPELVEFQNDSDTTLLIITKCNFKRSNHCELGYIYVWPK